MFSKTYFLHFNSTNLWILFYHWILLLLLLLNRCQTCGDSFTRYSEQNSQFLLFFRMLFLKVKKTTKLHYFNYLFAFDTIFFSWWPFSFFSGATCFNRMPWPFTRFRMISTQIFGQKLLYTFSFSYHLIQYFTNVDIVVCLIKNCKHSP